MRRRCCCECEVGAARRCAETLGLEKWLNDVVAIPYIRMDVTFRNFISAQSMNWGRFPEKDSLNLHNVEVKSKKGAVENEGFEKYQEFMQHIKCPEDVEA